MKYQIIYLINGGSTRGISSVLSDFSNNNYNEYKNFIITSHIKKEKRLIREDKIRQSRKLKEIERFNNHKEN